MNISNAQYFRGPISEEINSIVATIDGQEVYTPISEANRHYDEIMRQVAAGELTIADAD